MHTVSDLRYDIPRPPDPAPGDRLAVFTPPRPDDGYDEQWEPATVDSVSAWRFRVVTDSGLRVALSLTLVRSGGPYPVTAWLPQQRDEIARRVAAWESLESCAAHLPGWLVARMPLDDLEGLASTVTRERDAWEAERRG